jgi:hypothetical protein
MPRSLSVALVLVHTLFAATVLGGTGLLLNASSYDALDGGVVALTAYAAAPGVLGWWLARRTWEGGPWVRWALIAVQAWLMLGGLVNLVGGSAHGGVQLFLPILITCFLLRSESREWYALPGPERARRRGFSLARMIRWRRRDEGQTAIEYAGLVAIVVAIVTALVVSGLGTQILGGIQAQVCKVVGAGCPAPAGNGGDATGTEAGGSTDPGDGNTTTDGGDHGNGNGPGGSDGGQGTAGTGNTGHDGDDGTEDGDKKDTESQDPPEEKKDDGCFSGVAAFFGCAGDQVKQVGEGLFVDGVWGDLTGIWGLVRHPLDTLGGIGDYGKQLGEDWWDDSEGARAKWSKGDYFGAVLDWGGASLGTGGTVLYDLFVGDDAADDWDNGEQTRAVTHVIWNIGSLFIPGYDGAKIVEKVGELGKLGKLGKLGTLAEKAGKAAEDAKKAARAGDVEGAEKAAKRADEAADEAERKARESGCVLAAPVRGVPYGDGPREEPGGPLTGSAGTGTTVLAVGASTSYVVLAEGGCDEEAEKAAQEARKKEREAYLARKRAEEPGRAAKAAQNKKQYPEPKHDDTSDPRNYNPPDWAGNLKNHPLGEADNGDGYWASRDRNPAPNWKNESWLRYQEQITGTARGQEYVVPHPKEGVPDVEFDGWDSSRQTYLEAKNGYDGYLSKSSPGELTPSGKAEFVTEAQRQVAAAGGKAVEWHFSNREVAKAARRAFREEGLNIKVVYTEQKRVGGTRRPGAFG